MLQEVLEEEKTAPSNVLRIIETITKQTNTPRKKPKFINFVKNVCGQKTHPKDIEQAWDLISVKLSALTNDNNRNQNQTKNTSVKEEVNEDTKSENDALEENGEKSKLNGTENDSSEQNRDEEQNGETEIVDKKKLTKKQRKEEKKHKKYEAALQSAAAPPPEEEEEDTESKKGKKKKNKTESISNGDDDNQSEGKNIKNKKRKRQDTVNSVNGNHEATENGNHEPEMSVDTVVPTTGKTQKKKIKTQEEEEADDSICLHDQNVAKIGELAVSSDKFNWHGVILSVLEKKGNEVPFKRLQKKVLGEYSEATGREVDDRIADKFIKKLRSLPNVRVDKNRVLLID